MDLLSKLEDQAVQAKPGLKVGWSCLEHVDHYRATVSVSEAINTASLARRCALVQIPQFFTSGSLKYRQAKLARLSSWLGLA